MLGIKFRKINYIKEDTLRASEGMTLLELVFAVGILASALGILFSAIISFYSLNQIAEGRARSAMIMASIMETIRGMDFATLMAFNPNPIEAENANVFVVLEALNNDGEAVELPAPAQEANFPNPMEVRATILWTQQRGRVFTLTASTLVRR